MKYKPSEYDDAKVQIFITEHRLFNIRSSESFEKMLSDMIRIKIDGLITHQKSRMLTGYGNIYNKGKGLFIVDGEPFGITFKDPKRVRNQFYFDGIGEFCMMSVYEISIDKDGSKSQIFDPIRSKGVQKKMFSLAINLKVPTVDTLAPKLLLETNFLQ